MCPFTGLRVLSRDIAGSLGEVDHEVYIAACFCAAVEAHGNPHHRNECSMVYNIFPVDGNPSPPMVQLMPTKVMLNLFLSFHMFLTHKHVMSQALSPPWQTKYGDGSAKR